MLFSKVGTSVIWPNTIVADLAQYDTILWQACEVIEGASHLVGSHVKTLVKIGGNGL